MEALDDSANGQSKEFVRGEGVGDNGQKYPRHHLAGIEVAPGSVLVLRVAVHTNLIETKRTRGMTFSSVGWCVSKLTPAICNRGRPILSLIEVHNSTPLSRTTAPRDVARSIEIGYLQTSKGMELTAGGIGLSLCLGGFECRSLVPLKRCVLVEERQRNRLTSPRFSAGIDKVWWGGWEHCES